MSEPAAAWHSIVDHPYEPQPDETRGCGALIATPAHRFCLERREAHRFVQPDDFVEEAVTLEAAVDAFLHAVDAYERGVDYLRPAIGSTPSDSLLREGLALA